ncbi:RecX family transcriptional regulator [Sphingomonas oligophenolica]|uniref:RecX family transcriptional regulator n=1 Tax=Sphingomonas oligophenolica TaxID=301154 RepID=A0A502CK27_9SPHN|nr:RecX family transcriptional regulator [Sphingomonas oligophenolica]TPG13092.1 RecX family transcriptional regulator [Sphingomonas oligophenolica]
MRTARTEHAKRPIPPLDAAALERLALRYVERFATTRGRLADYLRRKVRERGWEGPAADPPALAQRMADLGYVDDLAYAEAKATAMGRRGLGGRRVALALRQAHVGATDAEEIAPMVADRAIESALTFARRRRLGPFGGVAIDRALREKQIGAMLRAGHGFDLSRRIVDSEREIGPDDLM